jgi:murein DD-endopeptidase MepM/ murein hydrolase activator NlpD
MTKWTITSGFHEHDVAHSDHLHQGIDFALSMDTPVRAFRGGIVDKITHDAGGFGNAIWIKFNDGYTAVLGHLDKIYVKPGERVYVQEILADSGNSGHSTGPHLHLGIMNPNGKWIDPGEYVNLYQVMSPSPIYGTGDWAHHMVTGWFDAVAGAIGGGVHSLLHELWRELTDAAPYIAVELLVVGGFLRMLGSRTWSSRLFVVSGVGITWTLLS